MNKAELASEIARILSENDVKKAVHQKRQVLHITLDDGDSADFVIKPRDRMIMYTKDDVMNIIEAFIIAVLDAVGRGESVTLREFCSFSLVKRKGRVLDDHLHDGKYDIRPHIAPKIRCGRSLKVAAKLYETGAGAEELREFAKKVRGEDYIFDIDEDEDGDVNGES